MIHRYPYTDFNEYNLDWCIERVKQLTSDWLETQEEWTGTKAEWTALYNYVHDYFDNLDVSQEVGQIIDDYRRDGTLATICQPIVDHWVEDNVPDQIDGWLDSHVTQETGYVLDSSLTLSNAAAPAKTVGDALTDVNNALVQSNHGEQTFFHLGNFQHYGLNTDGSFITNQQYRVSNNDPMTFDYDIVVSCADGFRWGYIPFVDGTAGAWAGWYSQPINIPKGTSFVVQIARVTEVTSEIADVSEFLSALTFNTFVYTELIDRTTLSYKAEDYRVVLGTINTDGGENSITSRARTTDYIKKENAKYLKCTDYNYKFGLHFYNAEKEHIDYTDWINSPLYTIDDVENCEYIRIVFARRNDANLSSDDLTNIKNRYFIVAGDVTDYVKKTVETYSEKAHTYYGEPMPSEVHKYDDKSLFTMSYGSGTVPQDIEVFDGYMFVAFSGTEHINVYSMSDYSLVSSITVDVNHGSGMQFSDEYYDASDDFPLLYVGGWTDNIINVLRITENEGTWSATIVRKLYIPTTNGYFMTPSVNGNTLYCLGYKTQYYYDPTDNEMVIVKCDLSKLTNNGDNTYTPKILSVSESPYLGTMQGRKYYGGTLFVGFAKGESPYNQRIYGIDAETGSVKTFIDLSSILQYEMEGICYIIENNVIKWICTDYFNVVELTF